MTNLFQTIAELVPRCHGWATVEKAFTLAGAVLALRPEVIVEIGVWGGRSLLPLGLAAKEIGQCKVIGVDPWTPSASIQGQQNANLKWWGEQPHEQVYFDFIEKRGQLGLNEVIKIERMTSDYFDPPKQIGILHLDGNHGPQAIKDAEKFGPLVQFGGFCFLDDLHWEGGNVLNALDLLRRVGFVELFRLDAGSMMQRISR